MNNLMKYASSCYSFDVDNVERVDSGTNKVFRIHKDNQIFYLRISQSDFNMISGEIHWIEYLLRNDIKVPEVVVSNNGKAIELFEDNDELHVICMFRELHGVYWNKNDSSIWNDKTFFNWGKTMGHMHRVSKSYRPHETFKRPHFQENFSPLSNYVAVPKVHDKMARIQNEILNLPKDIDSYGYIHGDMHQQNFLINENDISVLDFDSCGYGFYAHDIAVALYHAIWWGLPDSNAEKNDFALRIIKHFMSGYKSENSLSDYWLRKITLFMQYRQIEALSWHIGYYPSNNFTAVVYNDLFDIYFDFGQYIRDIENDVFFDGCTIDENVFLDI